MMLVMCGLRAASITAMRGLHIYARVSFGLFGDSWVLLAPLGQGGFHLLCEDICSRLLKCWRTIPQRWAQWPGAFWSTTAQDLGDHRLDQGLIAGVPVWRLHLRRRNDSCCRLHPATAAGSTRLRASTKSHTMPWLSFAGLTRLYCIVSRCGTSRKQNATLPSVPVHTTCARMHAMDTAAALYLPAIPAPHECLCRCSMYHHARMDLADKLH